MMNDSAYVINIHTEWFLKEDEKGIIEEKKKMLSTHPIILDFAPSLISPVRHFSIIRLTIESLSKPIYF